MVTVVTHVKDHVKPTVDALKAGKHVFLEKPMADSAEECDIIIKAVQKTDRFFDQVYGCDVSRFAIDRARKYNPGADLRVVDIEEHLPYPDEFFDCITALDVLEHTKSFEESLRRLVTKLKPRGHMIISTPIDAWPRRLFGSLDRDKTHISIPKESTLKESIQELRQEGYLAFPPNEDRSRLWLPLILRQEWGQWGWLKLCFDEFFHDFHRFQRREFMGQSIDHQLTDILGELHILQKMLA